MMNELSGKSALVTGASMGIGKAIAIRFGREGANVAVNYSKSSGQAKEVVSEIEKLGANAIALQADVSKAVEVDKMVSGAVKRFGGLDVLVNNAGIQRQVDFTSPRVAKLPSSKDDEVTINLTSQIRLCALFIPKLMKQEESAIVNVSSGLAFVPIAQMPIYCATKAAIHSFTTSLRHQLRNTSVRVFEAAPPTTDTELDASFAGEQEQAYRGVSSQEVAAAIIEGIKADKQEILVGQAQGLYQAALRDPEAIFKQLND